MYQQAYDKYVQKYQQTSPQNLLKVLKNLETIVTQEIQNRNQQYLENLKEQIITKIQEINQNGYFPIQNTQIETNQSYKGQEILDKTLKKLNNIRNLYKLSNLPKYEESLQKLCLDFEEDIKYEEFDGEMVDQVFQKIQTELQYIEQQENQKLLEPTPQEQAKMNARELQEQQQQIIESQKQQQDQTNHNLHQNEYPKLGQDLTDEQQQQLQGQKQQQQQQKQQQTSKKKLNLVNQEFINFSSNNDCEDDVIIINDSTRISKKDQRYYQRNEENRRIMEEERKRKLKKKQEEQEIIMKENVQKAIEKKQQQKLKSLSKVNKIQQIIQERADNQVDFKFIENAKLSQENEIKSFKDIFDSNKLSILLTQFEKPLKKKLQFTLSEQETELIKIENNTMVLGRSGTGKTTSAVIQMYLMQFIFTEAKKIGKISLDSLQLCFSTLSPQLVGKIIEFYNKLSITQNNKNRQIEFKSQNSLNALTENDYPLITSLRDLIQMIDGNLTKPFLLGNLIENQKDELGFQEENIYKGPIATCQDLKEHREITVTEFKEEFWITLSNKDKQDISTQQAYQEIKSYITGHFQSNKYPKNMLKWEIYKNLVGQKVSKITEDQKKKIYKICQYYQDWKKKNFYFDMNDIINYNLQQIYQNNIYMNKYIQFLFVDEVQDLNSAQIFLLAQITTIKLFLAGDTAQTISKGNSFRFSDLFSLFYDKQYDESYQIPQVLKEKPTWFQLSQNFRSHGRIIECANCVITLLMMFFPEQVDKIKPEISLNEGIKPLLTNDIDLVQELFYIKDNNTETDIIGRLQSIIVRDQQTVDQFDEENNQSKIPQAFKDSAIFTIANSKGLEFEDILIFNFFSSTKIDIKIWKILSKIQVKEEIINGYEFKQLYDFKGSFKELKKLKGYSYEVIELPEDENDLKVRVKIRQVIKNKDEISKYIQEQNLENILIQLNFELKELYVAITRAKGRVIFYDENTEIRDMVYNLLLSQLDVVNLIDINSDEKIKKDMRLQQRSYAVENSKGVDISVMIDTGKQLMERRDFKNAIKIFKQCNQKDLIKEAEALQNAYKGLALKNKYIQEKKQDAVKRKQINEYFNLAGDLFKDINLFKRAAQCYFEGQKYDESIKYFKKEGLQAQVCEVQLVKAEFVKQKEQYEKTIEEIKYLDQQKEDNESNINKQIENNQQEAIIQKQLGY